MDSKHRHELKTNELADWLTHAPEFLKRNASTLIGIVLIIVGLVTWPIFSRMRQDRDMAKAASITESIQTLEQDVYAVLQANDQDAQARQQAGSALLISATALMDQAENTDNKNLSALAQIKAAQALRTEMHLRADHIEVDDLHARIDQAQQAYTKALATAQTPTLKAMAQMGQGLCAEELGQRDAAAEIYRTIIDTAEYAATPFPSKAQQRLDGLSENLETFVFAPAPVEQPTQDRMMLDIPDMIDLDPSSVFQTSPVQDSSAPLTPPTAPALPDALTDIVPDPTPAEDQDVE